MMTIQVNTDNHIDGKENFTSYIKDLFSEKLKRFDSHLTRIEVHLSDENAGRGGSDDKKCNVEARIESHEPIFASATSNEMHIAINDALHKIKSGIERTLDKIKS
jgi:ribosomal subunit interface protein